MRTYRSGGGQGSMGMAGVYWSSDEEFSVEKILDVRKNTKTGMWEFLIKWEGYSSFSNSWEPRDNLTNCDEMLAEFRRTRYFSSDEEDEDEGEEDEVEVEDDEPLLTDEEPSTDISEVASDVMPALKRIKPSLSKKEILFLEGMNKFQKMLDAIPGPQLRVVNSVNHEPPPDHFVYITNFVYGSGVPRPDIAFLTGCECAEGQCGTGRCSCSSQSTNSIVAGSSKETGQYTAQGRLRIVSGRQPFIYECNQACSCTANKSTCKNRVIQGGRTVPLEIFQMGDARGWGVRAISHIPAGSFIDLYYGEIVTDEEADERYHNLYKQDERALYLFDLDFSAEMGSKADFTIDAYKYGSVSRFFNHSCSPNLLVVPCFIDHIDQSLHFIAFFAAKDIRPDEELSFDYTNEMYKSNGSAGARSKVYTDGRIPCLCGTPNCRKFVYPSDKH